MESESLPGGFGHPAAMTKYFSRADQNSGKEPAQIKSESAFSAAEWWFAIAIHAAGLRIKGAQPGADNTAADLSGFLCGQFAGAEAAEYSVVFIGHYNSP